MTTSSSRFACYLIAQNGDPRITEIANAQKYFALRSRVSAAQAGGPAVSPVGSAEDTAKRWVWDLYPLAKDSWGVWELEPEMPRPDHRIYMYRYQGDGYMGPVKELEKLQKLETPSRKILHREAYAPRDEDFALLKRRYPNADPHHPDWYRVKADLQAGNHTPDTLDKTEAPGLLALLATAMPVADEIAFGSSPEGLGNAGQGKAQISRESALERCSSESAQSAISANEIGAVTSNGVRTSTGSQSILKQIAEQIRAIPGMNLYRLPDAEAMAGRLLAESLKHGAFARIKHAPMRTWIDERIEKGWYGSAFCSSVNWFKEYEPHWPAVAAWQDVGSPSFIKNGCPLLADVLEAEADIPEGERVLTPPVPGRLEAVVLRKKHEVQIEDDAVGARILAEQQAGPNGPPGSIKGTQNMVEGGGNCALETSRPETTYTPGKRLRRGRRAFRRCQGGSRLHFRSQANAGLLSRKWRRNCRRNVGTIASSTTSASRLSLPGLIRMFS